MKAFRIIEKNTEDHWLEIEGTDGATVLKDGKDIPIWNMRIVCKWDGCVLYHEYSNGYGWDHKCDDDCQVRGCVEQSIHICDIDDMIDTLQKAKKMAIEFFDNDSWNKGK